MSPDVGEKRIFHDRILWAVALISVVALALAIFGTLEREDTEYTARRVERLSFFNVIEDPGVARQTEAMITLFDRDEGQNLIVWRNIQDLTLVADNGQATALMVDEGVNQDPNGHDGPEVVKCVVPVDGGNWTVTIEAEDGHWIASASFWFLRYHGGGERLCGEIVQSDGRVLQSTTIAGPPPP